jgi:hypothetical protein
VAGGKGRQHDATKRRAFLKARDEGATLSEAADLAGIPEGTAGHWDRLRKAGQLVDEQQEQTLAGLQDECARLRARVHQQDLVAHALQDAVQQAIKPLAPLRKSRPKAKPDRWISTDPEVAMLCVSDAQVGQLVTDDDTHGLNSYDLDTFLTRRRILEEKVLWMLALEGAVRPITELCVLFLGDMVEGETIFPGQAFQVDTDLLSQLMVCVDEFAAMLSAFASVVPQVSVYCVPGNHGRVGRRGDSTLNLDLLLYRLLPKWLERHDNVWFAPVGPKVMMFEKPAGQTHAILHGDQIKAWMNIPYYGIDRSAQRIASFTSRPIDCMWVGHHHQAANLQGATQRIANGSFVGASKFSAEELLTGDIPRQWLVGWGREGQTWEYPIRLAKPRRLRPDEFGILRGELPEEDAC